jgi:O-antigen ligase
MATTLALTAVALAAALALLLAGRDGSRHAAAAMVVALVGAPVILAGEVWDTSAVERIRDGAHGTEVLLAAALGGIALVALGAAVLRRWPVALPLAVAAVLPFRIPIDVGDAQPVNLLVPLYLVTGAAAVAWAWERLRPRTGPDGRPHVPQDPRPGAADALLVLFVVLYAVQSAWSDDQSKAVQQVAFFYVPFALLYVVLRTRRWTAALAARCLAVSAAVALVLAGVGFYEYATRTVLLNPKVIASNQIEDAFRVNSLFFDPNIYGRFLALVMLGLAAWMLWSRRPRTVAATGAVIAVLAGAIVLTLSQTSFLALLVGLAILGGLRFGPWRAFGATLLVLAVGLVVVLAAPKAVNLDGFSHDDLDGATSGRVALTGGGVGLFADHPLVGVGSGGFATAYRAAERAGERKAVDASHTIPITIAAEQGVIGLGVYVLLVVLVLRRLLRRADESVARAAIAAMVVALLVHTMGYAAFLEDPVLWVLLAVGGALAADVAPQERRPRRRRRSAERAARAT